MFKQERIAMIEDLKGMNVQLKEYLLDLTRTDSTVSIAIFYGFTSRGYPMQGKFVKECMYKKIELGILNFQSTIPGYDEEYDAWSICYADDDFDCFDNKNCILFEGGQVYKGVHING